MPIDHSSSRRRALPAGTSATSGTLTGFDDRLRELWIRSETAFYLCDSVRDRRGRTVDFVIRHFNEAARSFSWVYFRKRPATGRSLIACCPKLWSAPKSMEWLAAVVATGDAQFKPPVPLTAGGEERFYVQSATKSGDGIALGFREVTAEIKNRKSLLEYQAELHEAQRLGSIGSWRLNLKTGDVIWSPECHRIVGSDPSQPPPRFDRQDRFVTRESWLRLKNAIHSSIRTGQSYDLELQVVRGDGIHRWIRSRGEVCLDRVGKTVGLRGTIQDITDRKEFEHELRVLPQLILKAQEAERRRVAVELHDGVCQDLLACLHRLDTVANTTGSQRSATLTSARGAVANVLREVRRVSHALRPSILDHLGLLVALRELTGEFSRRSKIEVRLRLPRWKRCLHEDLEAVVYRVTQEALSNIELHALAKRVDIRLGRRGSHLFLTIRDDGRGFDPGAPVTRAGFGLGLRSMRERVELFGGTFNLTSAVGQGTFIMAKFPFNLRS